MRPEREHLGRTKYPEPADDTTEDKKYLRDQREDPVLKGEGKVELSAAQGDLWPKRAFKSDTAVHTNKERSFEYVRSGQFLFCCAM